MHEVHSGCWHCWLNQSCLQLPGLAAPKFHLGQTVEVHWLDEDCDRNRCDRGIVVGFQLSQVDVRVSNWLYIVLFTSLDGQPWLLPGHTDTVSEHGLKATLPDSPLP